MIFVSSLAWQELAGALKGWSGKLEAPPLMISVKVYIDRPNLSFFLKIYPDQVLHFSPLAALGRWGTAKPDWKGRSSSKVLLLRLLSDGSSFYLEFKAQPFYSSFLYLSKLQKSQNILGKAGSCMQLVLFSPKMIKKKRKLYASASPYKSSCFFKNLKEISSNWWVSFSPRETLSQGFFLIVSQLASTF